MAVYFMYVNIYLLLVIRCFAKQIQTLDCFEMVILYGPCGGPLHGQ